MAVFRSVAVVVKNCQQVITFSRRIINNVCMPSVSLPVKPLSQDKISQADSVGIAGLHRQRDAQTDSRPR